MLERMSKHLHLGSPGNLRLKTSEPAPPPPCPFHNLRVLANFPSSLASLRNLLPLSHPQVLNRAPPYSPFWCGEGHDRSHPSAQSRRDLPRKAQLDTSYSAESIPSSHQPQDRVSASEGGFEALWLHGLLPPDSLSPPAALFLPHLPPRQS